MKGNELKADATIITIPVFVVINCPKCGEEIQFKYDEFIKCMESDNISDWGNKLIRCLECGQLIRIDSVEWE